MPRRREVPKREILPDPVYQSQLATKFINNVMGKGKKTVAESIFYGALDIIKKRAKEDEPLIATARVKWDEDYQKELGVTTKAATNLPEGVEEQINKLCKRIYRALNLSGYARMDLRLTDDGRAYVLEANPNPNLSFGEDFSESAETIGISYEALLQRIMNLGLKYRAAWRG